MSSTLVHILVTAGPHAQLQLTHCKKLGLCYSTVPTLSWGPQDLGVWGARVGKGLPKGLGDK